ncbi:MAG: deoxyribodipyrimidine photo-lyase [Alphaproteobacteria bacterium]|nr:deoxyribodipyrimidine photo-lyase [Alphaproteobacteria bacterium]
MTAVIVWFRQDLRLSDNPALYHAVANNKPIIPLYILKESPNYEWQMRGAQRWWLHESLISLEKSLQAIGLKLILRRGNPEQVLDELVQQTKATSLYWNRCYEPHTITCDKAIKQKFKQQGIEVESFNGSLLFEPWTIKTQQGNVFKVFTPFWKACLAAPDPLSPYPIIQRPSAFQGVVQSDVLKEWLLQPIKPNWAVGIEQTWQPGEAQAHKLLEHFLAEGLPHYDTQRDRPDQEGTSRLSPYLHFGEISPRQIWQALQGRQDSTKFKAELGWREFSYYLLYHFSDLPKEPFRTKFKQLAWEDDARSLKVWQQGRTGYPLVDAGMRQLWHTGWMHNRVRMVTASFLTKHLLINWREGEKWFWDTLVDADLASNSASWQWVAGCGADAPPFSRIFNPIIQGEKFDPHGNYIRKWVPELRLLPTAFIHKPWQASETTLKNAGVELGKTYPYPMIEHSKARTRALDANKVYNWAHNKNGD